MNNTIFSFAILSMFLSFGCASTTSPMVNTAPNSACEASIREGASEGASMVVNGSKRVWNASKGAWEWVTSEENQNRANRFMNGVGRVLKATKNGAVEVYNAATEEK